MGVDFCLAQGRLTQIWLESELGMLARLSLSWLVAISAFAVASVPASAGDKPNWCKSKKDCVLKSGKWVASTAAGEAVINGAARTARGARDAVNRERRCKNTQVGNSANSSAAVRTC